MKVIDCGQLTPAWWEARRGVPTASEFHRVITPRTGKLAAGADSYIFELLAALYRTTPPDDVERTAQMNYAMRHGVNCEPEARSCYELTRNVGTTLAGFCLTDDGRFGCSPDFLVGDDGVGELKCPQPATQIRYLIDGGLPDEYRGQVHGELIVTGREWADFCAYSAHGLPHLLVRVIPDQYTLTLRSALEEFHERYQRLRADFAQKYGQPPPPPEPARPAAGDYDPPPPDEVFLAEQELAFGPIPF